MDTLRQETYPGFHRGLPRRHFCIREGSPWNQTVPLIVQGLFRGHRLDIWDFTWDKMLTIRAQIDRAICHGAADVVRNTHGKVITVDKGNWKEKNRCVVLYNVEDMIFTIVEIIVSVSFKSPLGYRRRRDALVYQMNNRAI